MARLLACFHTLADPELMSDQDWRDGCEAGYIDTSYLKTSINDYDESGLELACRYRDLCGDVELAALTIGNRMSDKVLSTLAALGYGLTARIEPYDNMAAPELTSAAVSHLITAWAGTRGGFDIIVTGRQSGDGNQGKTPVLIAEELGASCFTHVTGFAPAGDNGITVTWQTDDAECTAYAGFPVVLAVGEVPSSFLRVPTLRQRMDARQQKIDVFRAEDIADPAKPSVRLTGMEPVTDAREPVFIDGSDPVGAAAQMMTYYLEWLSGRSAGEVKR